MTGTMDYIYRSSQEEKRVGSVRGLMVTPFFDFDIDMGDRMVRCQMDHIQKEWRIHFTSWGESVELAYPTDVYWNMEAIYDVVKDEEKSRRIAYAVKAVFETIM